jgi:hypothetical protein
MGALVDELWTSAAVLDAAAVRCGPASSELEWRMRAQRIAALEAEACDAVELRERERERERGDALGGRAARQGRARSD